MKYFPLVLLLGFLAGCRDGARPLPVRQNPPDQEPRSENAGIPKGYTTFTLLLKDNGRAASAIKAEDRVDVIAVLAKIRNEETTSLTNRLLQNVTVLSKEANGVTSVVVLIVTPSEAETLASLPKDTVVTLEVRDKSDHGFHRGPAHEESSVTLRRELKMKLTRLRQQERELAVDLKPRHPRMLHLRKQIEETEAQAGGRGLLTQYKGDVVLPQELYRAYAGLVRALETGKQAEIEKFCIPGKITVTVAPRSKDTRHYGQNINLPFLKDSFHKFILNLRKDSDTQYLLRTGSTALWFTKTKEQKWKLSKYLDKPIR